MSLYGLPLQATGLANLEIGLNGRTPAIRWRCQYTGSLTGIVFFLKGGLGYSSGTGGTIRVDVENDGEATA